MQQPEEQAHEEGAPDERDEDALPVGAVEPFLLDEDDLRGLEALGDAPLRHIAEDPQEALAILEQKMARITRELAEGRINRAQFEAIYTHYSEQSTVIRRLMERNPRSEAWRRVAVEGHTRFLRQQYAAVVEGLLIYDQRQGRTLRTLGRLALPPHLLTALLEGLAQGHSAEADAAPQCTQIEGGRWLSVVSGVYAATIALFSAEPSGEQLQQQAALHHAFERLNARALGMGSADPESLTYPQEVLLGGE